jgi:hypothetical protein
LAGSLMQGGGSIAGVTIEIQASFFFRVNAAICSSALVSALAILMIAPCAAVQVGHPRRGRTQQGDPDNHRPGPGEDPPSQRVTWRPTQTRRNAGM